MERLETRIEGPVLVRPVIHGDHRGFFHESYRREVYGGLGIPEEFGQDNHSRSGHGRGIAYDDPDVAIEWPAGVELTVSARDASAPRLREIEDELPFVYAPALTVR
jgi:dTDP-4-dehydrorhamnose 3,5-epimerase-like enzyme